MALTKIIGEGVGSVDTITADNLTVDTNTLHVDSANNRVGVGTSSPAAKLEVAGGSLDINGTDDLRLRFLNGGSFKAGIQVPTTSGDMISGSAVNDLAIRSNANMLFSAGGNLERMRIDTSGNLLVGGTSAAEAGSLTVYPTGIVQARVIGSNVIIADRTSTDGEIIDLRKDGSTVGSIGTATDGEFIIYGTQSSRSGLKFDVLQITPVAANGTDTDGTRDLGSSNVRFRNLYLSGGVYVGGTGSANYLDDYEEGTWTPSVDSGTNTVNTATYTKVGRVVTVSAVLSNFSDTTTASIITISGLPFTVAHQGFGICDGERFDVSLIVAQARTSDSKIAIKNGVGSADFTSVDYADINNGPDAALSFIVTYFTT